MIFMPVRRQLVFFSCTEEQASVRDFVCMFVQLAHMGYFMGMPAFYWVAQLPETVEWVLWDLEVPRFSLF